MKLIDTVMAAISGEDSAAAAARLGVEPATLDRGLGVILPSLLGGVVRMVDGGGAERLLGLVQGAVAGGNPLDRVGAALADEASGAAWLEQGSAAAAGILGEKEGALSSAIADMLGLQPGTVSLMSSFAAPLLLGSIARATDGPPTAAGLAALTDSARASVAGALPPEVAGLLDPSWAAPAAAAPSAPAASPPAAPRAGGANRWLPWVVAGVAAVALIFGLRSCQSDTGPDAADDATATIVGEPLDQTVQLPRGVIIVVRQGGVVDETRRYLATAEPAGRRFVLDDLVFDDESNQLTGESLQTIDGIAGVMQAYPETRIRLIGFTDDRGDPLANEALSLARAEAVKTALVAAGVAGERIEAEGRGEAEPVASNDDEEGRARNRRVELEVLAK